MSRAMLNLWNGVITADPKQDWAQNGARMVRFPVLVTVYRFTHRNPLFYQVSVYGQAADTLIGKIESGKVKKGTHVNVLARVESHRIYTDKDGQPAVGINVTALEVEPIFGWMQDELEKDAEAEMVAAGGHHAATP